MSLPEEVELVLAPNPGPLTGPGTNSWIFGAGEVVIVDPGPLDQSHLDRLAHAASRRGRVAAVLCTHHHLDHVEGAERLCALVDAPLAVHRLRAERAGVLPLEDGDLVLAGDTSLRVIHTPGHSRDHICLLAERERLLFTGDHVLSGTTSVIWPPEGDMTAYLHSLERIAGLPSEWLLPGHGQPIGDPRSALSRLVAHRLEREAQVLEALGEAPRSPAQIAEELYRAYPPEVMEAARHTVLAHCLKLEDEGRVRRTGTEGPLFSIR